MNITLSDTTDLILALETMSFAVNLRPVVPELRCVKISVEDSQLELFSTTGHLSYRTSIELKGTVKDSGTILIDHALFLAALNTMQGAVEIYSTESNLIIRKESNHKVRSQIRLAVLENHPVDLPVSGSSFTVPAKVVGMLISSLQFAIIREGSRPELAGILFGPTAMSGDGTRIVGYQVSELEENVTIPVHALQPLQTLAQSGEKIVFTIGDRWIRADFENENVLKFSRLAKEFPGAAQAVLETYKAKAPLAWFSIKSAQALRILSALNVYSELASRQGISYCTMFKENDIIYVSVDAPTAGSFQNELQPVSMGGEDFIILFSSQAMLDILTNAGEVIVVKIFSSNEPLLIMNEADGNWAMIQGVMAKSEMSGEEDF